MDLFSPDEQLRIRTQLLRTARHHLDRVAEHRSLTHLLGAAARGWWTPPLHPSMLTCLTQTWAAAPPERRGVRAYRHRQIPDFDVLDGLRVAPASEILLTCARELGRLDMVVLVDGAIQAGTEPAEILSSARRFRGAPALRRAMRFADPRSESPWETVLRMFHASVGVRVESQRPIHDSAGEFLGRADLWVRGTHALHEYDGGHHLSVSQQRDDLRRLRAFTNAGWDRRGYTSHDLVVGYRSILRDCDLALGQRGSTARLATWEQLLAESLFTAGGQYRLRRIHASPRSRTARTEGSEAPIRSLGGRDPSVLDLGTADQGFKPSA